MSDAACSYLRSEKIDDRLLSISLACRQIKLRGRRHPRTLVVVNSGTLRPFRGFRETPSFPLAVAGASGQECRGFSASLCTRQVWMLTMEVLPPSRGNRRAFRPDECPLAMRGSAAGVRLRLSSEIPRIFVPRRSGGRTARHPACSRASEAPLAAFRRYGARRVHVGPLVVRR